SCLHSLELPHRRSVFVSHALLPADGCWFDLPSLTCNPGGHGRSTVAAFVVICQLHATIGHLIHSGGTAMAPRIIMRIELTPKAKEHLDQISDRQGMTQVAMLSRVI